MAGNNQSRFQRSFADFYKNSQGGFNGVFAGFPSGGGRGGNSNGGTPTTGGDLPPYDPNALANASKQYWTFPQYTQSWAFTPPTPTPYMNPQPFDTAKYGNPLNTKNLKKNV